MRILWQVFKPAVFPALLFIILGLFALANVRNTISVYVLSPGWLAKEYGLWCEMPAFLLGFAGIAVGLIMAAFLFVPWGAQKDRENQELQERIAILSRRLKRAPEGASGAKTVAAQPEAKPMAKAQPAKAEPKKPEAPAEKSKPEPAPVEAAKEEVEGPEEAEAEPVAAGGSAAGDDEEGI
jgi:type IV secretory pathway VirB10-like protein